jgi:hypothetical protein
MNITPSLVILELLLIGTAEVERKRIPESGTRPATGVPELKTAS